jgi:hypothetical protein
VLSSKKEIPVLKSMSAILVAMLIELRSKIGDQGITININTRSSEKLLANSAFGGPFHI